MKKVGSGRARGGPFKMYMNNNTHKAYHTTCKNGGCKTNWLLFRGYVKFLNFRGVHFNTQHFTTTLKVQSLPPLFWNVDLLISPPFLEVTLYHQSSTILAKYEFHHVQCKLKASSSSVKLWGPAISPWATQSTIVFAQVVLVRIDGWW